jgi:hypothetical protein
LRTSADGSETRCDGTDVAALVGSDDALNEIRANQVTRIDAEQSLADQLPLLLKVPGDTSESAEWSAAMYDKHLDQSTIDKDFYRVAYVSDERWYAYTTTDGVRMLPENSPADWQEAPPMQRVLGDLSYSEEGGMASGSDISTLGLVTSAVVATFTHLDEYADVLTIWARGDDTQTLIDWILQGAIARHYDYGSDDDGAAMLAELILEAALSESKWTRIRGILLAAGLTTSDDPFGASPTGWWSLSLGLEDTEATDRLLNRLSARNTRMAEIVAAGRNPHSALAQARVAALKELEDVDFDNMGY